MTDEEIGQSSAPPAPTEDGFPKPGLWVSFLSFVPPLNLVALAWGAAALKRRRRMSVRALAAFVTGAFFTTVYVLGIAGFLLPRTGRPASAGYRFLAELDPRLERQVALLEQGDVGEVEAELEPLAAESESWAVWCALGIAKSRLGDSQGAREWFDRALPKNPARSEFYFFRSLNLLEEEDWPAAESELRLAVAHTPRIPRAERLLELVENRYEPTKRGTVILSVLVLALLITLHEYAHGYAAWRLGDDTAKLRGRLSLNPLAHVDLFGTIILPALLIWQQAGVVFGWAKPVPINPANFSDPRRDSMVVSVAGPGVNLIIAMVSFVLLLATAFVVRLIFPDALSLNLSKPFSPVAFAGFPGALYTAPCVAVLKQLMFTSLILGCLNLIPLPPLDGSWILSGILPRRARAVYEGIRRYSIIILVLLVVSPVLHVLLSIPFMVAWIALDVPLSAMGFG